MEKKPIVPQFVADFIDSEQYSCSTLSEALDNMDDEKRILDWFYINSETFAKAWLFGYEVEREKLYTVELPNPNGKSLIRRYGLTKNDDHNVVIGFSERLHQFTESEIRKDFDWAWQAGFAKEVEE